MISKDMSILEILRVYPKTRDVFIKHGMGCIKCMGAMEDTLESGARQHGINIQVLLYDLNKAAERPD
ncbi:MAG: DUF1858 domain-containing protein [Bacillota bacterium]